MNIFSENHISYVSVSNLFIINHIVRFLTITNVERLKSLKSSFILFYLIFTFMQLIFWINIVSQVFSSSFFFFFFFLRRMLFPTLMPFHCFILQVLVVANPANTNALILKEFAPSIPEKNITCLTRLDHNRALSQIDERLKVYVTDVKNVI